MSHRSARVRLFVAIDPTERVCGALTAWARSAARQAQSHGQAGPLALRVLDSEQLHLTLCFLGDRPAQEIDRLAAQLPAAAGPVGELSLGAPLWLPPRHPRALAVELHDPDGELADLQAEVVAALERVSDWRSAERQGEHGAKHRFRPHITVARMRPGAAPRDRSLPPTPALTFVPERVVLYRSWLSPEGASYEVLAASPIG